MKLLTEKLKKDFPVMMSTDGQGDDAVVTAKFFHPFSDWTWYALEFDGHDKFFGLVKGFETEYGYFGLHELESNGVERDLYFTPCRIGDVK
jgi:hypothetical protein